MTPSHVIIHVGNDIKGNDSLVAAIERWKNDEGWATWLQGACQGVSHTTMEYAVELVINHLHGCDSLARYRVEQLSETPMNGHALQVRAVGLDDPDGMDLNLTVETLQAMSRML